jgi:hypothetical protein
MLNDAELTFAQCQGRRSVAARLRGWPIVRRHDRDNKIPHPIVALIANGTTGSLKNGLSAGAVSRPASETAVHGGPTLTTLPGTTFTRHLPG